MNTLPVEVQCVHRISGKVLGNGVPFEIPTRAAYVVLLCGGWKEVANWDEIDVNYWKRLNAHAESSQ